MNAQSQTTAQLDEARTQVVMDAAWEIEALAGQLTAATAQPLQKQDPDSTDIYRCYLVTRGICDRLIRLSGVLQSAVGEPEIATVKLEKIIHPTG